MARVGPCPIVKASREPDRPGRREVLAARVTEPPYGDDFAADAGWLEGKLTQQLMAAHRETGRLTRGTLQTVDWKRRFQLGSEMMYWSTRRPAVQPATGRMTLFGVDGEREVTVGHRKRQPAAIALRIAWRVPRLIHRCENVGRTHKKRRLEE